MFHIHVSKVTRNSGRSSVAAAAYRAASRLRDLRTGLTLDYRNKRGVSHRGIFAPEGVAWAAEREVLWNTAEAAEKRKDAATAREWRVALPTELDADKRRELAELLARELVRRFDVVVDLALHDPDNFYHDAEQLNYHAHLLTTTRKAAADGLGEKTRELDSPKSSGAIVLEMRAWWATTMNRFLEEAGADKRVDHRTLEAQKQEAEAAGDLDAAARLDRKPTEHRGPVRQYAHQAEREAEIEEERANDDLRAETMLREAHERADKASQLLMALEASERALRATQKPDDPARKKSRPFRFQSRANEEPELTYAEYVEGPPPAWATPAEIAAHERLMADLAAERKQQLEEIAVERQEQLNATLHLEKWMWDTALTGTKRGIVDGIAGAVRGALDWMRDKIASMAATFGVAHWLPQYMREDLHELVLDNEQAVREVIAENHAAAEKAAPKMQPGSPGFDM